LSCPQLWHSAFWHQTEFDWVARSEQTFDLSPSVLRSHRIWATSAQRSPISDLSPAFGAIHISVADRSSARLLHYSRFVVIFQIEFSSGCDPPALCLWSNPIFRFCRRCRLTGRQQKKVNRVIGRRRTSDLSLAFEPTMDI
jgi:hypothetical protein